MKTMKLGSGEPVRDVPEMSILHQNKGLTKLGAFAARLLEQDCLLCSDTSREDLLCESCVSDLPRLTPPLCLRCALPVPHGDICGQCLSNPPHFDATLAAYRYDFPLDKLIQSFKYGHRLALGAYFGSQIARLAAACRVDRILPMPLHPERLRERGFNQALELARPISLLLGVPLEIRLCQRLRHTPAQADLDRREREKNMRHAFHCTADLGGENVLLVDDVMTTGASLNECARTLKFHGAASVTALVVARAVPRDGS